MRRSHLSLEDRPYYRRDIDGLRGIAVTAVVLYHLFPAHFENGFLGVDIFFVISGFVVVQALERNLQAGWTRGLLDFYGRRVKRILPALYFNIATVLLLSSLLIPPSDVRRIFKVGVAAAAGASNLALLHARFDYFNSDLTLNPFLHTWSLGVEEQFYLIFPTLLLLSSRTAWRRQLAPNHLFMLLTALSFMLWSYLQNNAPLLAFYNPLARFWELLIGAALARNKRAIESCVDTAVRSVLRPLGALLMISAMVVPHSSGLTGPLIQFFSICGVIVLLTIEDAPNGAIGAILRSEPLVFAGKISYSLYLWHYPLFAIARCNFNLDQMSVVLPLLLLTVCISFISYRLIETPARNADCDGTRTIIAGGGAAFTTLLFAGLLYSLPPSRIYLGDRSLYAGLWPDDRSPLTASLLGSQRDCHLQYADSWSPSLFKRCSTPNKALPFIYLLGNSQAQHLLPMIEIASHRLGYGYTGLTISSCKLIGAFQMIDSIHSRYDLCKIYFDASIDYVTSHARSGDIVLIGADSFLEQPTPSDERKPSNIYIENRRLTAQEAYMQSVADLSELAGALRKKGVRLIFAGPTPLFMRPATQCTPEWFRTEGAGCSTPLSAVKIERTRYLDTIRMITSHPAEEYLWEPANTLCSGPTCSPLRGNKLLFRDQQHLSVYGSESLAPSFIDFIRHHPR